MVVVQIQEGKLRGSLKKDLRGKDYYSFQGIPYAAPPIGPNRFKAPTPIEPWLRIKDATKEGNESVSKHMITRKVIGSEDCLNLNVYTPNLPQKGGSLKPVMVFIHGGIFTTGSNKTEMYGPEFLMEEDVVLVTINYRLGVLGFLSLDDASLGVPGNAAFKDMVLALKWVQRNIRTFCGDPKNVTVFGQSAGAVSAHLLMLSPMTKGLLHKVILQSGSALNDWVVGKRCGREFAQDLGFFSSDDRKILPFLQSVPATSLLKSQQKLQAILASKEDVRLLGLVLERPSDEEPFFREAPIDVILSGNYNQVPLIMGYNWEEGMFFESILPAKAKPTFFHDVEMAVPSKLGIQKGTNQSLDIAKQIAKQYYNGVKHQRETHLSHYYSLCTDTVFLRDIYFALRNHLFTSNNPIYFYRLSLHTQLNIFKNTSDVTSSGVHHGDDLGYLFKNDWTPHLVPNSIEDISRRRITKLWSNFARFGEPTPKKNDSLLKIEWKPISQNAVCCLDIAEELKMVANPEEERTKFWTKVFKTHPFASKL